MAKYWSLGSTVLLFLSMTLGVQPSLAKEGLMPFKVFTELSPPYQTIENNQVSGITTDKVKQFLDKTGRPYEIEMMPWARAYQQVLNDEMGLIYAIAKTPTRATRFHWLLTMYEFKPFLVGNQNRSELNITDLEQAKQFVVCVQRHDFAHSYFIDKGFVEGQNLIVVNSIVDSWQLLKLGKVDYIIEDINQFPVNKDLQPQKQVYTKYFALKDLTQTTYLAANANMPQEALQELKNALTRK